MPKKGPAVVATLLGLLCASCERVIIRFNDQQISINDTSIASMRPRHIGNASLVSSAETLGLYVYDVSNTTAAMFCACLMHSDLSIAFCEPDQRVSLSAVDAQTPPVYTDDPLIPKQWGLQALGVQTPWSRHIVGYQGVRVCIMDSGIDLTHPDLQQNLYSNPGEVPGNGIDDDGNGIVDDVHGAAFLNGMKSNDINDQNGHGTLVAGVIGATTNNGIGIAGVSWNVSMMACRFMDASGQGQLSDAVSCYDYCLTQRAHIIHNSWGSAEFSQALSVAFQAISNRDVLVVTSAGNDGADTDTVYHYPSGFSAMYKTVLSVGAIDQSLALASLSNYGAKTVQLSAPGISIEGLALGGQYVVESGTSFAAPAVTAVAVMLYGYLRLNHSINIDTQNVATLIADAILNGTSPYPDKSFTGKTTQGFAYLPGSLTSLDAGLAAVNYQTTAIGGAVGIVVGIVIGLVAMFFIMLLAFYLYVRYQKSRATLTEQTASVGGN